MIASPAVEGQHLDHQGGPEIGAQHDRQPGSHGDQPASGKGHGQKGGRRRALQQAGHQGAHGKRQRPAAGGASQVTAQVRAEGAHDPRAHHARRPQEQGDAAADIQ
jgi:hypothetical protein